ncbi:hypothetical protein HYH03_008427 [Edaphochlamys debaryana]|uniref:Uncharacterized protein n=1 Tax=Edaphochlamys debaryana TaxID=47281 RepID=A0A835XZV8_9CHLO|nr:hypothetical protein HYH03_008427 [Edaphochlamys debaryana]|eukprot:KAG2493291.1 hypothetical protein HYH03_008427 [Edaphochlamys debaryana]
MGDMPMGSMTNLTGSVIPGTDFISAERKLARKGYPWCATSKDTAYFLKPVVSMLANTPEYAEYAFNLVENYNLCKTILERKKKAGAVSTQCAAPFYSFMIAVSDVCHEAIMSVKTVRMFSWEDKPGVNATEMYAHSHKGHNTGVPLLKYLIKPNHLTPTPGVVRSFTLSLRIYKHAGSTCTDLKTLCGGDTCMAALSDEEYETCPAFFSRFK